LIKKGIVASFNYVAYVAPAVVCVYTNQGVAEDESVIGLIE